MFYFFNYNFQLKKYLFIYFLLLLPNAVRPIIFYLMGVFTHPLTEVVKQKSHKLEASNYEKLNR